jgi:hypothetical protein
MNDHVAVLRRTREFLSQPYINDPEAAAALDHAIAAIEQRDALVAWLGELEKGWRIKADMSWVPDERLYHDACANALARVVKESGND